MDERPTSRELARARGDAVVAAVGDNDVDHRLPPREALSDHHLVDRGHSTLRWMDLVWFGRGWTIERADGLRGREGGGGREGVGVLSKLDFLIFSGNEHQHCSSFIIGVLCAALVCSAGLQAWRSRDSKGGTCVYIANSMLSCVTASSRRQKARKISGKENRRKSVPHGTARTKTATTTTTTSTAKTTASRNNAQKHAQTPPVG